MDDAKQAVMQMAREANGRHANVSEATGDMLEQLAKLASPDRRAVTRCLLTLGCEMALHRDRHAARAPIPLEEDEDDARPAVQLPAVPQPSRKFTGSYLEAESQGWQAMWDTYTVGNVRLRHATAAVLQQGIRRLRGSAFGKIKRAQFLEQVAARLEGDQTVEQVWSLSEIEELHRGTAAA